MEMKEKLDDSEQTVFNTWNVDAETMRAIIRAAITTERPPAGVVSHLAEKGVTTSKKTVERVFAALERTFGSDVRVMTASDLHNSIVLPGKVVVEVKLLGVAEKRRHATGARKLVGKIVSTTKDERAASARKNLVGVTCFIDISGTEMAHVAEAGDLPQEWYGNNMSVSIRMIGATWAEGVPL